MRAEGWTMLDRRDVLKLSALAAALVPLVPLSVAAQQKPAAPRAPAGNDDWDAVRRQFRLSDAYIHMSAMLLASHPAPVRAAIERHREGLDADTVAYIVENDDKLQM